MCSSNCVYGWLDPNDKLFYIVKNMARCVNVKEKNDVESIAVCYLHYQFHICKGEQGCNLTKDGTCSYTGKTFDGHVRTDLYGDFSSNALELSVSGSAAENYTCHVKDIMELDIFIDNVHKGFNYMDTEDVATALEDDRMRTLLPRIHAVMSYNKVITKTVQSTPCQVWVDSTIQVLRGLKGKSLIPNMISKPEVKAIVIQTLQALDLPKRMWWTKRSSITRQWIL